MAQEDLKLYAVSLFFNKREKDALKTKNILDVVWARSESEAFGEVYYLTKDLEGYNLSGKLIKHIDNDLIKKNTNLPNSKKYTIEDVRNGIVGIEYKGDAERLNKILKKCFPNDCESIVGYANYFKRENFTEWSASNKKPDRIKIWVSEKYIQL